MAWYPIYRIPDGNLRAAFLTYHSLGHFTRRRTSLNTSCGATSLVSPVVGLQSYNTKVTLGHLCVHSVSQFLSLKW